MKKLLFTTLLLCIQSVYALQIAKLHEADLPNPAIDIIYKDTQIVEVIVNQWQDRVDTKEGRKYFTFQQGYNYHKKQG